jgi:hypothetical protein
MSNSLAKKRRANLPPPPMPAPAPNPSPSNLNQPPAIGRPMTLPQVLSILEKRLSILEKSKDMEETTSIMATTPASIMNDSLKETLDEYETRFDMLAEQINYIKDTLMKLQTFTMEVNQTLLLERREAENNSVHFSSLIEEKEVKVEDDEE